MIMKKLLISLALLISLPIYSEVNVIINENGDTIFQCGKREVVVVVKSMKECQYLKQEVQTMDSIILHQEKELNCADSIICLQDSIITLKDQIIDSKDEEVKQTQKKAKKDKWIWGGVGTLIGLLVGVLSALAIAK